MKLFILTLLLTFPVFARTGMQYGIFQVEPAQSSITLINREQETYGFVDIREDFKNSVLRVESADSLFESSEIEGTPESFIIRGHITQRGIRRLIQLKGKSFSISNKVAWKLHNDSLMIRIIAERPHAKTTELQKQVERIYQ